MDVLGKITALRERRGWTVWKLAEESGVDQSIISAWYTKGRIPSVLSIEKLCEAFGITLSQFFMEDGTAVSLSGEQRELIESWSALSKTQQEIILLLKSISAQSS